METGGNRYFCFDPAVGSEWRMTSRNANAWRKTTEQLSQCRGTWPHSTWRQRVLQGCSSGAAPRNRVAVELCCGLWAVRSHGSKQINRNNKYDNNDDNNDDDKTTNSVPTRHSTQNLPLLFNFKMSYGFTLQVCVDCIYVHNKTEVTSTLFLFLSFFPSFCFSFLCWHLSTFDCKGRRLRLH